MRHDPWWVGVCSLSQPPGETDDPRAKDIKPWFGGRRRCLMKLCGCGLVAALALGLVPPAGTGQEGKSPRLLLQVIRLKPGEAKRVELALPYDGTAIRPSGKSGRDSLFVYVFWRQARDGAVKEEPVKDDGKGVFRLPAGVEVVWVKDRAEVELRAGANARAVATDVRVVYQSFGGGPFVSPFRVIVEAR
jgi:hypothetical protein